MSPSSRAPLGGNLVLASLLAVLSYVPFEWVAKGSLLFCAFLFIVDPIPPISRLLSIISLFIVYWLSKLHNQHLLQQQEQEQQEELLEPHIVTASSTAEAAAKAEDEGEGSDTSIHKKTD